MTVRDLGAADRALWLDVARRCPYATYFHTPAWAELMSRMHPALSIATRAFRLADGRTAVLPLLEYAVDGLFRGYESMAPGVYGGPIAERPLSTAELDAILDAVADLRTVYVRVFGNPFLDCFRAPPEHAAEFTHVVDLRGGFDAVFRRLHRNHRRAYKSGAASGLVVDRADSLQDFRDYFTVYQADRARWGARATTDDSFALFEEMHARRDPGVVLWLARLEGRVVAGDLWLYWNEHNVGWHGAADPEEFGKHPTNFLLTEIIRDACARGAARLDLNPSGGHEGVVRFKDSFGAERLHFRHAERRGGRLTRAGRRLTRWLARPVRELGAGAGEDRP